MKNLLGFILLPAAILLVGLLARSMNAETIGPHGGKVQRADNYFIEMKRTNLIVHAYLLDRKQAPLGNRNLSCQAWLYYPDSTIYPLGMSAQGPDGFFGIVPDTYYTSIVIMFNADGKHVSATFENTKLVVQFIRKHETTGLLAEN